jgi:hypothetical protein
MRKGDKYGAYINQVGISEVKKSLGRNKRRRRIILKWFLKELACEGVDCIPLAHVRG